MSGRILIVGALGQIGIELTRTLREKYGNENVIASDIKAEPDAQLAGGPYAQLNVLDKAALSQLIDRESITEVYQLAALLSATAEKYPDKAWDLNMNGLFNILETARARAGFKVFWPSSIAAFGPTTPRFNTPQQTIMEPTSVYGISKLAGERWCEYYHHKYGVDVRSVRYPGLIGYRSEPGGGTTDYAVEIFYHAIESGSYTCFLGPETMLPMMMMDDAIRATISLMEAPSDAVKVRSSYNIAGCSFTPAQLAAEIQKQLPAFRIEYRPDFRQQLADSWPASIDDSVARSHWGWQAQFDTPALAQTMLREVAKKKPAHT